MKSVRSDPAISGTKSMGARPGSNPAGSSEAGIAAPNDNITQAIARLFEQDLDRKETRIQLVPRHPMLDHRYIIETPEIELFKDICFDCALARKSGTYAHGMYRQGKTKAIASVIIELEAKLPFTATLSCIGQRNIKQSKENFFQYLLNHWDCYTESSKKKRYESQLITYIMARCEEARGFHCVLFIDEAQLLSVQHYRYLLELWNSLRDRGYLLSTILVGQPELVQLKDLTKELDHGAVVSRFFVKEHSIGGIKSAEMLADFLAHYDDKLRHPEGSNWSYSRFFLTEAFDQGWRLKQEGPVFWQALCNLTEEKKKRIRSIGFRLAWIVDAIHAFLLDNMKNDGSKFHGTVDMWQKLIVENADADLIL